MTEPVDLPQDVVEFLDKVWAKYKDHSASALWTLTHSQDPWVRNYVPGGFHVQIPDEDMSDYFRRCVPAAERIFHSGVVILPIDFLDDSDEDVFATKFNEYLRSTHPSA